MTQDKSKPNLTFAHESAMGFVGSEQHGQFIIFSDRLCILGQSGNFRQMYEVATGKIVRCPSTTVVTRAFLSHWGTKYREPEEHSSKLVPLGDVEQGSVVMRPTDDGRELVLKVDALRGAPRSTVVALFTGEIYEISNSTEVVRTETDLEFCV